MLRELSFEKLTGSGRDARAPGARVFRPLTIPQFMADKAHEDPGHPITDLVAASSRLFRLRPAFEHAGTAYTARLSSLPAAL